MGGIHFDSKCFLKGLSVYVGGVKTGGGATGERLDSFLVLFQLFYKNKIKVENLIQPRVKTPQYILGRNSDVWEVRESDSGL